ncbi:GIY-YIG catalytic domain protein [Rickettsia felis str. Pedreira]|uniref:GIY-YIG catalytic domain protein n=2 Tax=Rickettsia felis TaxID=42862 RepID=A0A0F3MTB4_RICFI|nr:Endo/excinuclease amino terminal domain protein [Rickettsia felis URRWXCal2]KJV59028.1 GIY-YIG catalytic domain protein [Rickettsia felis str. Pedreira]
MGCPNRHCEKNYKVIRRSNLRSLLLLHEVATLCLSLLAMTFFFVLYKLMKQPIVYIVTNKKNGILYTGVTSNLIKRIYEHKNYTIKGFSKKYNCKILVFYEIHQTMNSAINREKQIKAGSRDKKIKLIEQTNINWDDLYSEIIL